MSPDCPTLAKASAVTCFCLIAIMTGCSLNEPNPAATATSSDAGIRGTTMVDAGCPMSKDATPCADKPISAKVIVIDAATKATAAEVVSDTAGKFAIALPAGTYQVQAGDPSGAPVPYAAPRPVTVDPGRYIEITIQLDSGVR